MDFASRRGRAPLAFALLGSVAIAPARAADIDAASRIDAVTVYPDAALVTRIVDLDLPAGVSRLTLRGLPMSLDPNSLRVQGEATIKLTIGGVDLRVAPANDGPRDSVVEAKLRKLRADRAGWQTTLDALEAKKAMMIRFSQAGPEKLSPDAKALDVAQWSAAWDAVGQGLAKVGDEIRAAAARAKEIDDEIAGLEQARQRPQTNRAATREAVIAVEAEAATKGRLTVHYQVSDAGWRPAYDARLTSNAGLKASLDLVRRASVVQRSGEDWNGVALSVSTTRARRSAQAPEVYTERLDFNEPVAAPRAAMKSRSADFSAAPAPAPPATAAASEPGRAAQEQQATLDAGAWQASFQIADRVDVPSDGTAKNLRISTLTLAPELIIRSAPSLDEAAYLQAHVVNNEDAPLLPGQVSIQRDGAFVGVTRIGLVAPGDGADLGFGADDRVKVVRTPIRRKENEPTWFGSTKTDQREFKTSVKNLHPFPVKVSVVDRIPISENSAIVVEQLASTTPPTDKNVGERRGVLGWTFDLAPNEAKDIRIGYRMKWPADRDVVLETLPNASLAPRPTQ